MHQKPTSIGPTPGGFSLGGVRRWIRRAGLVAVWVGAGWVTSPLAAFPPAPHYVLYGVVRDQVGATLSVEGADIVLLRDGKEIGHAPIFREVRGDLNYELNIAIDQNRSGTRTYSSRSVPAQGIYSLLVRMNGQNFYPIEVSGTLRAGNGGERVRLDLNLGIDGDNDGLPDVWEEWQLYQAGQLPYANGWDLSLVSRDGDLDGDGISDYNEYLAGTFAGDATERFELVLVGRDATQLEFQFFAITGKVYRIEESTDLQTWTPVAFTTTAGGPLATLFRAPAVDILPAYVATPPGTSRFYRLSVR